MSKLKKHRSIEHLKSRYGFMFSLPWLIGVIIFFLLPLVQSIIYSFAEVKLRVGGLDTSLIGLEPSPRRSTQPVGAISYPYMPLTRGTAAIIPKYRAAV